MAIVGDTGARVNDGIPTMLVKPSRDGIVLKGKCPYCNKLHTHGSAGSRGPDFGHRESHCVRSVVGDVGYYLKLAP